LVLNVRASLKGDHRAYEQKDEIDAALDYVDAPASLGPLRAELFRLMDKFERALRRHAEHEELVIYPPGPQARSSARPRADLEGDGAHRRDDVSRWHMQCTPHEEEEKTPWPVAFARS
jgi:hypothetical protein